MDQILYGIEGACMRSFSASLAQAFQGPKDGSDNGTSHRLSHSRVRRYRARADGGDAVRRLGASIIRLDRLTPSGLGVDRPARFDLIARARPSVAVDLKHPDGLALAADLIGEADALIEGFRPGTMERLGLARRRRWRETRGSFTAG